MPACQQAGFFPRIENEKGAKAEGVTSARKEKMAKRLFVGSLPYEVTDSQLEELFSSVGSVESANIITDRFSGRSKGFGFVDMSSDEEAEKAIKEINGKEISGRNIVVNEAKPREERPNDGRGGFEKRQRRY